MSAVPDIIILFFFLFLHPIAFGITNPENAFAARTLIDILLLFFLFVAGRYTPHLRTYLYVWKKVRIREYLYGILYAPVLILIGVVLALLFPTQQKINFPSFLPLTAGFLLTTSIMEELFFRNYLIQLGRRLRMPLKISILLSTALFTLGHIYQSIPAAIFSAITGIFFCYLMLRHQSIMVSTVCHSVYNLSIYLLVFSSGP